MKNLNLSLKINNLNFLLFVKMEILGNHIIKPYEFVFILKHINNIKILITLQKDLLYLYINYYNNKLLSYSLKYIINNGFKLVSIFQYYYNNDLLYKIIKILSYDIKIYNIKYSSNEITINNKKIIIENNKIIGYQKSNLSEIYTYENNKLIKYFINDKVIKFYSIFENIENNTKTISYVLNNKTYILNLYYNNNVLKRILYDDDKYIIFNDDNIIFKDKFILNFKNNITLKFNNSKSKILFLKNMINIFNKYNTSFYNIIFKDNCLNSIVSENFKCIFYVSDNLKFIQYIENDKKYKIFLIE